MVRIPGIHDLRSVTASIGPFFAIGLSKVGQPGHLGSEGTTLGKDLDSSQR